MAKTIEHAQNEDAPENSRSSCDHIIEIENDSDAQRVLSMTDAEREEFLKSRGIDIGAEMRRLLNRLP